MILGLGGEASHTGRPGTLGEYIQFGKQRCSIAIELYNENGPNYLIERTIEFKQSASKENQIKSEWCLNRKKAKLQEVKDLVGRLNIFTDNLCQFLPQEKVVEFCKLDKQQLLSNTEKAVGNIQMYDDHDQLVKLSAQDRKNREEIVNLEKQFETFNNLNQHYEAQVAQITERKETEAAIRLHNQKKPWMEYERARSEYNQLKARALEIERRLQEKKNKLPFDRIIMKKKNELKKLDEKLKDNTSTSSLTRANDQIKQQLEQFVEKQRDEVDQYNMQFSKVKRQQVDIENAKKEIRLLSNQLDSIQDEESLRDQMAEIEAEIKTHVEINSKRHDEKFQYRREQKKIEEKLIQKKTLLKRETNVQDQRMERLRQIDERVWEITKWLERNKGNFRGTIFPPMMLYINAKKPEYIDLVEALIPKKDLLAFMCTDESDISKLNDMVHREFKHRISVLTTPGASASQFLSQQDHKLLDYFEMFACDLFTCPEEIMAYLYSQSHLHQIPVNTQVSERVDLQERENKRIFYRRCIANGNINSVQRSEYDGELLTEIRPLQRARFLCGVQNEDKIRTYQQEIAAFELEIAEWSTKTDEIDREFKQEQDCMNKDKERLNVFSSKINERSKLEHKIKMHENKLRTLEEFKIDLDEEKEKLTVALRKIAMKKLDLLEARHKELTKTYSDSVKVIYDRFTQIQTRKQIGYVENVARQYEETFRQLEEELRQSKETQKEMKRKADTFYVEANRATGTDPNSGLPTAIKKKFDKIPDDLDELNTEIRKLEMKLVFFANDADGSEQTQRAYQENKDKLKHTENELRRLNGDQERITIQKESMKQNWLREINSLIGKISEKFQLFMRKLNFDGYVQLYTGEDENDFEKYGISVYVRYRDEEPFSELQYNKHSGGERSVATMIYIIALQKLTAVPFRVVDEINQVSEFELVHRSFRLFFVF